MKNLRCFNGHNVPYSLSNLEPYLMKGSTIVSLVDAVEDSRDASDLEGYLSAMLPSFDLDRVTPSYVRFKHTDSLGNVTYLRAEF